MQEEHYEVKVENIFEGPMDLLVFLIRKNEINVYDIPIALLTDQYLAYLEWLTVLNIDNVGDFLMMAATLLVIKSKMLLPIHDGDDDGELEDPRMEIARPLIEYLKMKSVAEGLAERHLLGEDTFTRDPENDDLEMEAEDEILRPGLFELIEAFQRILDNLPGEHRVDLTAEKISIKDKIAEIIDRLEQENSLLFQDLFDIHADKTDLIVTFLAILEMARLGLIRIMQHIQTGVIRIFYL